MRGALHRGAIAQQQQLCRCTSQARPVLPHSTYLRISRTRLRSVQALQGPDEPQQQPASSGQQQQQPPVSAADPQQQQQIAAEQQADQQADQQAEDALDPQAAAAVAAALALDDEQAAEEELVLHAPPREVDYALHKTAETLYTAMAAALAVVGLAVSVYAVPIAESCLKLGGMPLVQAAALVGCAGAGVIRAASLALFLAEGAKNLELGTWRYQRINVALLACCALTALMQPLSFAAAQPWLLAAVLALSAAGAAACGSVFMQLWRKGGVYFASAVQYGDWIQAIQASYVYFLRDISSLAGILVAALGVVAAVGGLESLMGPPVSAAVPWLTGAAAAAQEAGLQYMRKLLGVGLLLTGVQCWALSEFASWCRMVSAETAVKLIMIGQQEQEEYLSGKLPAPLHVSPRRFDLLHVGFFAAGVIQGLWLWTASSGGGPAVAGLVNLNEPAWAPLYWTVLCSAAYLATVVARVDFAVVWSWIVGFASYLSGWISFFTVILYADWEWLREARRK